jgi:hypothetical protein
MATTSLTVGNELLTTTAMVHLQDIRSSRSRPYPMIDHMLGIGLKKQAGGERIIGELDTNDHSVPTRVQTGYEGFDDTALPVGTPIQEDWYQMMQPIFISKRDRLINRGKAQLLDQVKIRTANVEEAMRRDKNKAVFRGPAASGSWGGVPGYEDLNTFNGADDTTGLVEPAASGTNTLHGLAKASYPAAVHFMLHNLFYDAAGAAQTNLLLGLYDFLVKLRLRAGAINPKEIKGYASTAARGWLKRALRSSEQYVSEKSLDDGGRMALTYGGVELHPEDQLPQDGATSAANKWSFLFINWAKGMKYIGMTDAIMAMDPFETISGTRVQAAVMHDMGNLVSQQPGHNAVLVDAEAW